MPRKDEHKMEASLNEAREKLDAAIEIASRRALTASETSEFRALEKLVTKLAAKLGRDRIQRPPAGPRKALSARPQPAERRLRLVKG